MSLVKTTKNGNVTTNIHDDFIPKDTEKYKQNLKVVYDTMNMIFSDKTEELFYSEKELEEIKSDGTKIFI